MNLGTLLAGEPSEEGKDRSKEDKKALMRELRTAKSEEDALLALEQLIRLAKED